MGLENWKNLDLSGEVVDGKYEVKGELGLHGVKKEITVTVEQTGSKRVGAAFRLGGWFPTTLAAYIGLVLMYSAVLKRVVFVDVLVLAAGFVLRVVGGAVAIDVPISRWLLLCAYLLALYLALGKRRSELQLLGEGAGSHREVLGHYSPALVDQAISVVLGATVLAYTLYTVAPDTVAKVGSEGLMATVPVVLYGLFRYLYLIYVRKEGGNPGVELFTDPALIVEDAGVRIGRITFFRNPFVPIVPRIGGVL